MARGNLRDEDYVEHLSPPPHSYFFSPTAAAPYACAHEIPIGTHRAAGDRQLHRLTHEQEAVIDTHLRRRRSSCTRNGMVKKTRMSEYDSSLRTGLIAINLNDGDELVKVVQTNGNDDILMVSRNGMSIRFSENDVRAMGRATAGVRGMKLKNAEDAVVSFDVVRDDTVMLFVSSSGHGKRTRLEHFHRQGRGGQGVRGMKITASRGSVVAAFTVAPDDEILVFSSGGNLIRMGVREISSQRRDATGVRVARLASGETVSAVAPVLEADAGEGQPEDG